MVRRVQVLKDMGHTWRLSTHVLRRAVNPMARLALLPELHVVAQVLSVAWENATTWTGVINDLIQLPCGPTPPPCPACRQLND